MRISVTDGGITFVGQKIAATRLYNIQISPLNNNINEVNNTDCVI